MLQFKDIELTDKEWVCELLSYSDYNSTEYNFTVLFLWKHYYNTKICRYKDYLLKDTKTNIVKINANPEPW